MEIITLKLFGFTTLKGIPEGENTIVVQRELKGKWYDLTFIDSGETTRQYYRDEDVKGKYETLRVFTLDKIKEA